MRIIVSTERGGLDDRVNPAFGRAPTFTLVGVDDGHITKVQVVENPGYNQSRGAGVTAAQFCIDRGVDVVISGHFGPNSAAVLQAAGIKVTSASPTMTVEEAVKAFLRGELTTAVFRSGGGHGRSGGRG
ncbi:NifB/NifX family molybdenum-iron cluster-binding protein [Thermococcus thermotolerans]|uniref:NifB/NifX family molybdenum-iron cluster-binding protein n=1 Tax=Thermococcus thermotolerans TaxID=2969672 RepID=UPI00215871BD|nr:NifB/NifX family molybdenum-iron cluster-binding protein [Thermococcus thermotolerans]